MTFTLRHSLCIGTRYFSSSRVYHIYYFYHHKFRDVSSRQIRILGCCDRLSPVDRSEPHTANRLQSFTRINTPEIETLVQDVRRVLDFRAVSGLDLNPATCELFAPSLDSEDAAVRELMALLPGCVPVAADSLTLLGSPVLPDGLPAGLDAVTDKVWAMQKRLPLLGAHQGLFLLRSSFSACRVQHLLRSTDCSESQGLLEPWDDQLAGSLESVLGLKLSAQQRSQAQLQTSKGGLGLNSAVSLAGPSAVASMVAVSDLVQELLSPEAWLAFTTHRDALSAKLSDFAPEIAKFGSQKAWMERVHERSYQTLLDGFADVRDRARLLAVSRPGASDWLHAIPADSLGTRLDDRAARICVGLRLGASLVEPHRCSCGEPDGCLGHHGLSCGLSAGRRPRHAALNDTLSRALRSAGVPSMLGPTGLTQEDGRRPDGLTLIPFSTGRAQVWDATVTDCLSPTLVGPGASRAGSAVSKAEAAKTRNTRRSLPRTISARSRSGRWEDLAL